MAGRAIWFYLGKLFWPAELDLHLSALAGQPGGLVAVPVSGGGAAAGGRTVGAAAALARAAGGVLFFVGTLFPVLGFFNVYPFIYSFVADHFQYLASLGIIALVSAGAALLLDAGGCGVGRPATCCAWRCWRSWQRLTWRQSRMYADVETLYRTTIDRESRLLDGPQQPRHRSNWPPADRRGDSPLQKGPGNQSQRVPRPTTTSAWYWPLSRSE